MRKRGNPIARLPRFLALLLLAILVLALFSTPHIQDGFFSMALVLSSIAAIAGFVARELPAIASLGRRPASARSPPCFA